MEFNCKYCFSKFEKKANEKECSTKCRLLNRIIIKNNCWIWCGAFNPKNGYGLLRDGEKTKLTHRLSYEIFKGKIEKGKYICHSCDNKLCINPDHLWIGSQSENIQDALNKKRWNPPRGESNGKSLLSEENVIEIRKLLEQNMKQNQIAEKFNIDQSTVSDIKRKKRWKHL